jgi:hypothetical protein
MLPVIWTDDDAESECKTYFNLYTFVVFLGWIGLAVITGRRVDRVDPWPAEKVFTADNVTDSDRFLGRVSKLLRYLEKLFFVQMTVDTYIGSVFSNCIVAVLFGIFKCTSFAEVLFTTSEVDSQLELKEKHYDKVGKPFCVHLFKSDILKIKRKTLYWIVVELLLIVLHMVGIVFMFEDIQRDLILLACILCANLAISVLDLQYIHMCMVLCKRYR